MSKTLFLPASFFVGLLWLWGLTASADFGLKWQSTSDIRKNVTVVLENNTTITGDMTMNWDRSYNLTDTKDGSIRMFQGFKMMTIPTLEQEKAAFPFRTVLPFLLYCLVTIGGFNYCRAKSSAEAPLD